MWATGRLGISWKMAYKMVCLCVCVYKCSISMVTVVSAGYPTASQGKL